MRIGLISVSAAMALMVLTPLSAQEEWPYPQDIPQIENLPPDLIGEGAPDIIRFLKVRRIGGFELSPDGGQLAFTATITGEPQLWAIDAQGGWPQQMTFGSGITFFRWTHDGSHILYASDTNGDEREGYTLIRRDGGHERLVLENSDAFRSFGDFSEDGKRIVYASTERNGVDFDIYVTNLDSGQTRMVYEGRFGNFPSAWRPGGNDVLLSETRGEDANDLHLLNVESGAVKTLFNPDIAAAYHSFNWTPDGAGFYLATNQDREFTGLAYYNVANADLRFIETPDVDVDDVALSHDGRYLLWVTNEGGYSKLHARDLTRKRDINTPDLPKGVYSIDFAENAPQVAIRVTGPQVPGDVWTWHVAKDKAAKRVTHSATAGIDMTQMAVPEAVFFNARDGVRLNGLFYLPEGVEKPPLVMMVHGGPSAQARPDFDPVIQYLVGRGMAVLDLNFRGSTGFGKTFARLDNKRLRPNAVRDVADAVAWLDETGKVDTNRLAIMGGSYGGYMTNAAMGEFPDKFVAGVSFVGVSDWVRALETASPALKASDREEYGDITDPDDRAFFASISPINNAAKIKAPLMVLHGANDPRDPVAESDHLVKAVRDAGGEAVYLRFPDEGHGIRKLRNRVHAYHRIAAFLEEEFGLTGEKN